MRRYLTFLIYTNIFVACSAFCLYKITEILFQFNNLMIGGFVFFSTLFCYNYMRVFNFLKVKKHDSLPLWIQNNKSLIYVIILTSGFFLLFFCIFLGVKFLLLISPVIFVSLFYQSSINLNGHLYSIRGFPLFKIFIISITWSYITIFVPLLYEGYLVDYSVLSCLFQRILFLIAILIPFDIRDIKVDTIQTIPNTVGVFRAKLFGWFCLFIIQVFLIVDVFNYTISLPFFLALFISIELTSIVLYFASENKSFIFYGIIVEGLSIIMCLFVLIASFF